MISKEKILSIITCKKYQIIMIISLALISLIIVGIIIFQYAQEISFINWSDSSATSQYDRARLEIFRLCFVMLLITGAAVVSIQLC